MLIETTGHISTKTLFKVRRINYLASKFLIYYWFS